MTKGHESGLMGVTRMIVSLTMSSTMQCLFLSYFLFKTM